MPASALMHASPPAVALVGGKLGVAPASMSELSAVREGESSRGDQGGGEPTAATSDGADSATGNGATGTGAGDSEEEAAARAYAALEEERRVAKEAMRSRATVSNLRRCLATHVKRVIRLFEEWDEDGDGTVSQAEFRLAIRSLAEQWGVAVSRDDVDNFFRSLDADGSGYIEYSELREMVENERAVMAKARSEAKGFAADRSDRAAAERRREGGAGGGGGGAAGGGGAEKAAALVPVPVESLGGCSLQDALRDVLLARGKQAKDFFRELDADGSGAVSRDEFGLCLCEYGLGPPSVPEAAIDALFEQIDTDGSGWATPSELSSALRKALEPPMQLVSAHHSAKGLRFPLRSKAPPLPSLAELDAMLDRPLPIGGGKRGVQWDDPAVTRPVFMGGGAARRSAAVDVGRLRAQLRGHDTGLDAQLTPLGSPRGGAAGAGGLGAAEALMRHYASSGGQRSKVGGFKQKFKEVTTGVYSQTSVSSQLYLAEQQRVLREGRRGRVGGGGYGGEGRASRPRTRWRSSRGATSAARKGSPCRGLSPRCLASSMSPQLRPLEASRA